MTSTRPVEPYMQLLDSLPLFCDEVSSADPDYDDAALEDMLHQAHRARPYHSLREDLSVSLSSSSMSDRTWRPVERRYQESQIRTLPDNSAKQKLINTNFKQLEPKKSNDSFKDNYYSKIWNNVKLIKEVSL